MRHRLAAFGFAVLLPLVPPVWAADDPVIAVVEGKEILKSDLMDAFQRLPKEIQGYSLEAIYQPLVESLVDTRLAAAEARRLGIGGDAGVKRRVAWAEDLVLEREVISRQIADGITDQALESQYQELKAKSGNEEEIKARHILLENEAAAREVIAELAKGSDFAELATRKSKDPMAANGGDLGYFGRGDVVPEFAEAAFALEKGAISKTPVKPQFGWHVIKVEDRRKAEPPAFAEAKPALRAELSRRIGTEFSQKLRARADIRRFNLDGTPLKE